MWRCGVTIWGQSRDALLVASKNKVPSESDANKNIKQAMTAMRDRAALFSKQHVSQGM